MGRERLKGWFVYAGVWGLHVLAMSANLSLLPWGYENSWGTFVVLSIAHAYALIEARRVPGIDRITRQAAWIVTVMLGLALVAVGLLHLVSWMVAVLSIVMVANHIFVRTRMELYGSLAAAVIMLVFSVASPIQKTGLLGHVVLFMALLVATLSVARIQTAGHGLLLGSNGRIMAGRGLALGTAALLSLAIGLILYVVTPQKGLTDLTWSLTKNDKSTSNPDPTKSGEGDMGNSGSLGDDGSAGGSTGSELSALYVALTAQGMSSANAAVLAVKIKVQLSMKALLQTVKSIMGWLASLAIPWWWVLLILALLWYAHRKKMLLRAWVFGEYVILANFIQPTAITALASLKRRLQLAGITALPHETLSEYGIKVKAVFPVSGSFLQPIVLRAERELYAGSKESADGIQQAYIDAWRSLQLGL